MAAAQEAARDVFGIESLRPEQERAITALFENRDVLFLAPTGYGKSLVYQLPALVFPGLTLVVSPLIALMKDQVDKLSAVGVPAVRLTSDLGPREQANALQSIRHNEVRIVYLSPEKAVTKEFQSTMAGRRVDLLAADESHCHSAGTLIETPAGGVPVEELRVGDRVLSWESGRLGVSTVSAFEKKRVGRRRLLEIVSPAGKLMLTDDHPVWVQKRGWVAAGEVRCGEALRVLSQRYSKTYGSGGEVLQRPVLRESYTRNCAERARKTVSVVRETVLSRKAAGSPRRGPRSGAVLRGLSHAVGQARSAPLVPRMRKAAGSGLLCAEAASRMRRPLRAGRTQYAHDAAEPDAKTGMSGKDVVYAARDGALSADTRRERCSISAPTAKTDTAFPEGDTGVCDHHKADRSPRKLPDLLQGGSRVSSLKSGCGDRRPFSRSSVSKGCRPEERRSTRYVRVESVTVLQPGSHERDASCGRDNRVVYSLTVERAHCYFAEGVLTHNCISTWGMDFRPSFSRIGDISALFPGARKLALTATATAETELDIRRVVGLKDPVRIFVDPTRPNLSYHYSSEARVDQMATILRKAVDQGSAVVYVATRRKAEEIGDDLRVLGFAARSYHAGMNPDMRLRVQEAFMCDEARVIVATCAFGLGVDKSSIRCVFHWHQPESLFAYSQESGRGGRDGEPCACWLNLSKEGRRLRNFLLLCSNPQWYVYSRLWDRITHARNKTFSVNGLIGAAGIKADGPFTGQVRSALAFMEFHGDIVSKAGPLIYRLPILNPRKLRELTRGMSGKVDGAAYVIQAEPGDDRLVRILIDQGAVAERKPDEHLVIRPQGKRMRLTEADVTRKRDRAERSMDEVERFAQSGDKAAHLRKYFARAEGKEVC